MTNEPKRYQISVSPTFLKDFMGLSKQGQRAAMNVAQSLTRDPASRAKPLKGHREVWSANKHPYRVLFTSKKGWVHLFAVGSRGGAYDRSLEVPVDEPTIDSEQFEELTFEQLLKPAEAKTVVDSLDIAGMEKRGELTEEMITKLHDWNVTEESLEILLDVGIPDYVWYMLEGELQERKERDTAEARNISLIRNDVLDHFFNRIISLPKQHPVEELVLVSPWISAWATDHSSLDSLAKFIASRNLKTKVITRPPTQDWHQQAVDQINSLPSTELYFVDNLHAKYYLCDMSPAPFSIIASANITGGSFKNEEIGVMVRGRGALEPFVRDLHSLTYDLIAIAN